MGVCYPYRDKVEEVAVDFYSDGSGPLWGYWVARGHFAYLQGIVRADTWETAYECCEDEIMDDPDPEIMACFLTKCRIVQEFGKDDYPEPPEGVHYRSNGEPSNPRLTTCYAYDPPMGSQLRELTIDDADNESLNIRIEGYN
jgi:hypothetical protein